MSLREAKIILPHDAGERAHRWLRDALGRHFGGHTVVDGRGYWEGLSETVAIYHVAVAPDSEGTLRHCAAMARDYGKQQCVYLCLPSGDVELV